MNRIFISVVVPVALLVCAIGINAQTLSTRDSLAPVVAKPSAAQPWCNSRRAMQWRFAQKVSLDFRFGDPVLSAPNAMDHPEGTSTISDANGALLFYSNGLSVWDRINRIMPNGNGLKGDSSATQGSLIVPKPGDANLYFLFTVPNELETQSHNGLNYSVIDMRLNSGFGDVVASSKNTLLFEPATEKLCAVQHANGCDMWVLAHESATDAFYAYMVTSIGVLSTPVISKVGSIHRLQNTPGVFTSDVGQMKFSPDGHWIGVAKQGSNTVELFRFDPNSGVVSAPIELFSQAPNFAFTDSPYGIEFSPDGSKLYAGIRSYINKWDLSSNNYAQISASASVAGIDNTVRHGGMQLGPNGVIYIAKNGTTSGQFNAIKDPNLAGGGSTFIVNAIDFGTGKGTLSVPNFCASYLGEPRPMKITGRNSLCDKTVGERYSVLLNACSDTVTWYVIGNANVLSKSPFAINLTFNGWGKDSLIALRKDECGMISGDTMVIDVKPTPFTDIGVDTVLCAVGFPRLLDAGPGFTNYFWQDGSRAQTFNVTKPGTYRVTVENGAGCFYTDFITIVGATGGAPNVNLGGDRIACENSPVVIDAGSQYFRYVWSDGSTSQTLTAQRSGVYSVIAYDSCGTPSRDTIQIFPKPVPAPVNIGPDTALCGDNVYVLNAGSVYFSYKWSDGSTGTTMSVSAPGSYTVEVADSCGNISYDTVTVAPSIIQSVPIRGDTSVCLSNAANFRFNSIPEIVGWVWDFGDGSPTSTSLNPSHRFTLPGVYVISLALTDVKGCTGTVRRNVTVTDDGGILVTTIDNSAARIGDPAKITVRLSSSVPLSKFSQKKFTAYIRFNASMMVPKDRTLPSTMDGVDRILTISGTYDGLTDTLFSLPAVAALGNAECIDVSLDSVSMQSSCPVIVNASSIGQFCLTDVCKEGDGRLVRITNQLAVLSIRPDPASGVTQIRYRLTETGRTSVTMSGIRGDASTVLVSEVQTAGEHTVSFDADAFASGIYLLSIRTPTGLIEKRILIQK